MKRFCLPIYTVLFFLFTGGVAWAGIGSPTADPAEKAPEAQRVIREGFPDRYQLRVTATNERGSREWYYYLESDTAQEILEAGLPDPFETKLFSDKEGETCTLSITVKVRVGWDSNFVEASGTVSGIPCEEVVDAIKRLKQQLLAGIK